MSCFESILELEMEISYLNRTINHMVKQKVMHLNSMKILIEKQSETLDPDHDKVQIARLNSRLQNIILELDNLTKFNAVAVRL